MFWWGRVNSIIAIVAFGGSALAIMSGAWAQLFLLWFCIIALRVALVVVNVLHTAITGNPLFYDTKLLAQRGQRRGRRGAEEEVVDDE